MCLGICLPAEVSAQTGNLRLGSSKIDSLKTLLSNTKEDTSKIKLLREIGIALHNSKESLPYYQQALKLSQKIKHPKLETECNIDIGIVQYNLSNYPQALDNYLKSLRIYESLGMEKSKEYAIILNNIGIVYELISEYDRALEFYQRSLRIKESLGMGNSKDYAMSLGNIGIVYMNQGAYDRALEFYQRGLRIFESLGMKNSKEYAASLNNIGIVYYNQNKKDSVLYYFIRSMKIEEKICDKAGVATSMNNIGGLFSELGKYDNALDYLLKGLDVSKEIDDKYGVMLTTENLAKTYAKLDNHKAAYQYHQKFSTYKDSIFNEEKSKEIGALETRYELDKQKEISEREAKQARVLAEEEEFRSRMITFSWSFLGIIAFIFIVIFLVRKKFPVLWAARLLFFAFMMLLELTLLILEPQILKLAQEKILALFALNCVVAGVFFPAHKWLEKRVSRYLAKFGGSGSSSGSRQSPTSNEQSATSNSEHPTSNIQHQTSNNLGIFIIYFLLSCTALPFLSAFVSVTQTNTDTPQDSSNNVTIQQFKNSKIDSLKSLLSNTKDDSIKIELLRTIGHILNQSKESLPYFQQALELSQKIKHSKSEANCYNDIGYVQQNLSNYPKALDNFLKSLRIRDSLGMENTKGYAINLNNIGVVYQYLSEYDRALEFYQRSLSIYYFLGMENSKVYANSLNNIGNVYGEKGEYDLALEFYQRGLRILESLGMKNSKDYASSLSNIGAVHYYQNNKDSALYYGIRSLKIKEVMGDKAGVASSMFNIGELFSVLGNYDKALEYLLKGLVVSKESGFKHMVMLTSENLAKTYAQLDNHKAAYQYHQEFSTYKDSIFNEEKSKEIGGLEEKYEWEKQERQRKYQEEDLAKIAIEEKQRNDMLTVSGAFIVLVILIVGLLLYAVKLPLSIHFIEGLVFVVFMMFFELTLVFLNPYIDMLADGNAIINLLANSAIAACLAPLHEILEGRMKRKILRDKRRRGMGRG
ncbi:MAG: hypothetical protein A3H98_12195 [Bacteroidetes bacterium RIFCSPLOWO2_02_FULL_36_8]|nr:MAG: hypothetical protein A3H98_12195 [Bacteroidetes bacterium RIFCSPLOWO2_02_FULL_36_8]OFY70231.1 MAG: hypothetical protein A3G23_08795 [Bacteroidetes bacterium RIFCSPLOWO2_12_FULL_37_12]